MDGKHSVVKRNSQYSAVITKLKSKVKSTHAELPVCIMPLYSTGYKCIYISSL